MKMKLNRGNVWGRGLLRFDRERPQGYRVRRGMKGGFCSEEEE